MVQIVYICVSAKEQIYGTVHNFV